MILLRAFFCYFIAIIRFGENGGWGIFEVAEFESVLKIEPAPFLAAPGPIFAQHLNVTQKWLTVRDPQSHHRVSRQILLGYGTFAEILK